MRIIVIGGTGTIGKAVVKELAQRHEVIIAGYKNGDIQVDITQPHSIDSMYQTIGKVDAVVSTTGEVHFGELTEMQASHYKIGLESKLMGQVNVVLRGINVLNEGGSFTLTAGILSQDPIRLGSSAAMVNGALESFAKSAAIELPRGLRINVISPTVLQES